MALNGVSPYIVDTHCHLNHSDFDADCDEAIDRARQAGVERMLVIGADLAGSRRALQLVSSYDCLQAAVGIHPESAAEWTDSSRDELIAMARANPGVVVAWGEVGLDYHWESISRERQASVFSEQIAIATDLRLPLVVHCRDAYGDVLEVLSEHPGAQAVLHCFTGTTDEALWAVEAGYYLGVGGIATFKKSEALRETIKAVPVDRLLLETDAPYLAPQGRRGKRNEPAFTAIVAETIAAVLELSTADFARITTGNATRLFGPGR